MKILLSKKYFVLYSFVVMTLICTCFVKFQGMQLTSVLNDGLKQQQTLQTLLDSVTRLVQTIDFETQQRQNAVQQGFFKSLRPRELKSIIKNLALKCGIDEILIEFDPLQYNVHSHCATSVKLTFQTALDQDVFQLIDILQKHNIGLIDIKELSVFREDKHLSDLLSLKAEIRLTIINHHETPK